MYFSYSDSLLVTGNHVSRVRFGLHYMFSHWNRFEHNLFTDNAAGAVIMNSNGVIIRGNVFAWNAGSRSYGLVLQTATEPRVEDNVLVGNGIGVFLDNVIRGRFTGNLVARNWLGFQLFTNSEATEITDNAIAGNTFDVAGGGGADAYRFCVAEQGNYWEQAIADGYDLDDDGRLDTPHDASSPLAELARDRDGLRLFLQSPAARALEWAEHTFPVFDVQQAVDSCPLRHPPAPAMLASLPASREGGEGSARNALAASGLILAAGIAVLALPGRRRSR
jgi:nitrous oxidase accessory protein